MFDVYGDEIVLDGHTVGRLELPTGSLRDRALDLIESAGPDMVSEKDHAAAIEEAREESYAYGKESGREEALEEAEGLKADAFDKGFEEGRADAFVGMARARDAKRVEALLAAVSQTHDALEKIARQRYPAAKLGELKRQALATCSTLRLAVNAFQAPNGSDEDISAESPAPGTENPGLMGETRRFMACSGQSWSHGKRRWGVRSPVGPAWWRLSDRRGRTRLYGSMAAAERVARRLELLELPESQEAWREFPAPGTENPGLDSHNDRE